jgi:phage gp29-like protein
MATTTRKPAGKATTKSEAALDGDLLQSIHTQAARDRLWDYFEREQGPADVRASLAGAMSGDTRLQHLLFSAMLDTWPKLQKAINEMARRVVTEPWAVIPFAKRGEEPDEAAMAVAGEFEEILWGMRPKIGTNELSLEGLIRHLVFSNYYGHGVAEIRWHRKDGMLLPRAIKPVPARFYGYPAETPDGGEDRLVFYPDGQAYAPYGIDFPDHRFLVAVNTGHPTHPAMAAPLRALAPYWLAAVYGLKWMMNFTQLFGIPWRHAEVGDVKDEATVKAALASIGSTGYIVTKPGSKINVLDGAKGGDSIPQAVLIDLADRQCDQFILGQTLTSGTDNSGSRALGEVHENTLHQAVKGIADFVGGIITQQLIPAIGAANYGRTDMLPEFWARHAEAKDDKARAERMEILSRLGLPMDKAYVYEDLGVPVPQDDADLFRPQANGAQGDPATGGSGTLPHETKPMDEGKEEDELKEEAKKKVAAADSSSLLTVDQLSTAVLEGLTGVSREWLAPVRPFFARLAALAMSKTVSDQDFLDALDKAQAELPEIFELMDAQALEEAFMQATSSAALAGSVSRYER